LIKGRVYGECGTLLLHRMRAMYPFPASNDPVWKTLQIY